MHQLIKRLQIYKNALNTLKQRFVDMEIENLEDYNNEVFKIINGIIEYISLSVNRNIDNKEEKYLEVQKKKLEEEIKKKTKKLKD